MNEYELSRKNKELIEVKLAGDESVSVYWLRQRIQVYYPTLFSISLADRKRRKKKKIIGLEAVKHGAEIAVADALEQMREYTLDGSLVRRNLSLS